MDNDNLLIKKIKYILWRRKDMERIKQIHELSENSNKIYLVGTPEYFNIGDHLIATAEHKYFKDYFPEYTIIEITKELLVGHFERAVQNITSRDVIVITGGGFLGDLYPEMEKMIEKILNQFNDNLIIFFPSTVHFSGIDKNIRKKESLFADLNNARNVIFFAREQRTYNMMSQYCGQNMTTFLVPDIALYYNVPYEYGHEKQNTVGVCIRTDKESSCNFGQIHLKVLEKYDVDYFSTVKSCEFLNPIKRKIYIDNFLKKVGSYKFVITDRLHCMIMCLLTKTPCVVFDNSTGKINGVYALIKNNTYINMAYDYDDYITLTQKIDKNESILNIEYDDSIELFVNMTKILKQAINGNNFAREKNESR